LLSLLQRIKALVAMLALITMGACSAGAGPHAIQEMRADVDIPTLSMGTVLPPLPITERVLQVPLFFQKHRASCEAAALRMALAYIGISVDELTLISYMGDDTRPARFDSRGGLITWGDPMQAFVGNPDGRPASFTGYGVYYAPVARAAEKAGGTVLADGSGLYGSGIAPADAYMAILQGHPVVAWISNTYRAVPLATYVAYDKATVPYTLTEHAVTLIGVRPDAVLVNDPWFGQAWRPKAQFESAYRTFADMAVVIG
jgi:uncharacterized protein YvpB